MNDLIGAMLAGAWEAVSAGAVWICVWGCIGRLAGHTRGRPIAGAWLGMLLGPLGAAIAFCLADRRGGVATPPRTASEQLRERIARRGAVPTPPREPTEMERFDAWFAKANPGRK